MSLIEQSNNGDIFAVAYQDNGKFFVSIFNNEGEDIDTINVSNIISDEILDVESKPITGFFEPLITCCFIEDDNLLVQVYHRIQKKHYHFTYSYKELKILSDYVVTPIKEKNCTDRNFPIKSFYSVANGACYTFYRQGQCFETPVNDYSLCHSEKITDSDLGNMFLVYEQALVVRSSGSMLFFKKDVETDKWTMYHEKKDMRG
jgi:hypothetical protein